MGPAWATVSSLMVWAFGMFFHVLFPVLSLVRVEGSGWRCPGCIEVAPCPCCGTVLQGR